MTQKIASIVVPVDFGNASARAIALAGQLSAACGGDLLLLHAELFDVPPYFTPDQISTLEREREVARRRADEYLRTFGRSHTPHPFRTTVVEGPAVDVILHTTRSADLVVMGTHGRRGVSRWWLGSVAERVLRDSRHPVVVVHEEMAVMSPNPVVVVTTAGDTTRDALVDAYGRSLAACLQGRVAVVPAERQQETVKAVDAALVVSISPWPGGGATHVREAERLIRGCARPVLFVPDAARPPRQPA